MRGAFGSAGPTVTVSAYVECTLYGEERGSWRGVIRDLKDGMEEYEIIKGYCVRTEKNNRKRNNEISESIVEQ